VRHVLETCKVECRFVSHTVLDWITQGQEARSCVGAQENKGAPGVLVTLRDAMKLKHPMYQVFAERLAGAAANSPCHSATTAAFRKMVAQSLASRPSDATLPRELSEEAVVGTMRTAALEEDARLKKELRAAVLATLAEELDKH